MMYMRNSSRTLAAFIIALAIALTTFGSTASAACLGSAAARNLVNAGSVLSLGSIAARHNIQIYSAQLCSRGNGYVYELMVRGNGGNVRKVIINAQTGQRLS
jgi:hypothetical protein